MHFLKDVKAELKALKKEGKSQSDSADKAVAEKSLFNFRDNLLQKEGNQIMVLHCADTG